MTVVNVRQVFVLVGKRQMSVFGPGKYFDRTRAVVWIAWIDGVCVHHDAVNVAVSVMGGPHDDHANERHSEGDNGRERQPVTVDRPGKQYPDKWRQRKYHLP